MADSTLDNLLHNKATNQLILELKETVSPALFEGMDAVTRINDTTWKFVTADADGLRRKILELSLHHNLNIVSLQSQGGSSLEAIFRELTQTAPGSQVKN